MNIQTLEEADKMSAEEMQSRLEKTREILAKAGAHYVIDSLEEIEAVIDDVNARLARGERP